MRRIGGVLFLTLLGLALGIGLGLAVGWLWWPVEYIDTEIADLKEVHQADYVLMVSDDYALTGDLEAARVRLNHLQMPDVADLVRVHAEAALAAGASRTKVGRLARLAVVLGASSPALMPYLTPVPEAP